MAFLAPQQIQVVSITYDATTSVTVAAVRL